MANKELKGKYLLKNTAAGTFTDVTTLFDGVRILKVDGIGALGDAKNIYLGDWVYTQTEDMMIVMADPNDTVKIIRENTDIDVTFIVHRRYASSSIDVLTQHDAFISYMTDTDVWVKSAYVGNKYVHCIATKDYKPTVMKLHRGADSYIIGTVTLHTLDAPQTES